jgi:hypothetical protein
MIMSFTSTLPVNLTKFSYISVAVPTLVTSLDSAIGVDAVSSMGKMAFDVGSGLDAAIVKPTSMDQGIGIEQYMLKVKTLDQGLGGEYTAYMGKMAFDSASGLDFTSLFRRQTYEYGVSIEASMPKYYTPKPAVETLSDILSYIDSIIGEVGYGREIKTIHYDIIADATLSILNLVSNQLGRLANMGVILGGEVYDQLRRVWSMASSYKRHKAGDIIWHSDENALIDMLKGLEDLYNMLSRYMLLKTGDTAVSSETSRAIRGTWVYLFNEGDWSKAKDYVDDNTIIFVTITIGGISNTEVQNLVNSKRVVFMVEIDTEPFYPYDAPAFYNVFYTVLAPSSGYSDDNYVVDPEFTNYLYDRVPALFDYFTPITQKVSGAVDWARYTGSTTYGWSYKKYSYGAIMEIPYDGFWKDADWLGRYVDAASNILLKISRPYRILYLGRYTSGMPDWHGCYPVDACWKTLCSNRGWTLADLR